MKRSDLTVGQDYAQASSGYARDNFGAGRVTLLDLGPFTAPTWSWAKSTVTLADGSQVSGYGYHRTSATQKPGLSVAVRNSSGRVAFVSTRSLVSPWTEYVTAREAYQRQAAARKANLAALDTERRAVQTELASLATRVGMPGALHFTDAGATVTLDQLRWLLNR